MEYLSFPICSIGLLLKPLLQITPASITEIFSFDKNSGDKSELFLLDSLT